MQGAGSILSTGGSIGVGISSPTRKLDVRENSADDIATFINSDTSGGFGVNVKGGGTGANCYALRIANGADNECFKVKADGYAEFTGANDLRITIGDVGTAGENSSNWIRASNNWMMYNGASGGHIWEIGGTEAGRLTASGWVDSKGPVRSVPATEPGNTNYTLQPSDAGKYIDSQGTGNTVTIPQNTMSKGDVVTIVRATSGDVTIAQGIGVTMYHSADGANTTTGNRVLAQRGMVTMIFVGPNYCYISGSGLS